MKKLICMLLAFLMLTGSACATILDPKGVDLEFKLNTGIEAKRAEVLCKSLSALAQPNARASKVKSFSAGKTFLTWESEDIWLNCYYSDGADPAWVRNYYVLVDPHYYRTDNGTAVYAYGSTNAPRVGLTDTGDVYPIIMENGDWVVISIRGASGWIRKNANDYVHQCWLQPADFENIKKAELYWTNGSSEITNPTVLAQLSALLMDSHDMGAATAGCPFGTVYMTLTLANNERVTLDIATDSCNILRVGGHDIRYGVTTHASSQQLLRLFPGYH